MARKVRVSRHGLSACPRCRAHVPVAANWRATTCGFCGAGLLAPESTADVLAELRTLGGRAGGAMAAALLSLGVACSEDTRGLDGQDAGSQTRLDGGQNQNPDAQVADSGQNQNPDAQVSDAGQNGDATLVDSGEVIPGPEYGEPPMDSGVIDSGVVPDSGLVPDSGEIPVPLYGLPPPDAGEKEDSGEPVITPLYGISPSPDGGL